MTVWFVPSSHVGNPSWRVDWPARELIRRGWDVGLVTVGSEPADIGPGDVAVIHYTGAAWQAGNYRLPQLADDLIRAGAIVVGNYDDDWHGVYRRLAQAEGRDHHSVALIASTDAMDFARRCSALACSTPVLAAKYGRYCGGPAHVTRNYPPQWIIDIPLPETLDRRASWMGYGEYRQDDVAWLKPGRPDWPLLLHGDRYMADAYGIDDVIWQHGRLDDRRLYRRMRESWCAFVPLIDDDHNRAKSWIKPLEYLAVGVPVIATRQSEYVYLASLGAAVAFADTPAQMAAWVRQYLRIPTQTDRRALGRMLRESVADLVMETRGGDEWETALRPWLTKAQAA